MSVNAFIIVNKIECRSEFSPDFKVKLKPNNKHSMRNVDKDTQLNRERKFRLLSYLVNSESFNI